MRKRIFTLCLILVLLTSLCGCEFLDTLLGTTEGTSDTTTTETPTPEGPSVAQLDPTALQVHYIDCGQADSILILAPTGESMLIDAGDNENESRDAVLAYLAAKNITKLDWLVLTHPHADHIGGAKKVLTEVGAKKVLLPDKVHTTKLYSDMLDAILDTGAQVVTISDKAANKTALYAEGIDPEVVADGSRITLGGASLQILGPVTYDYGSNLNNYSVMLRLDYGAHKFLFTGDAETKAEEDAIAKFGADAFRCDVLKSGHHGSDTSSATALVQATHASIAVIQVGTGNDYGHPCAVTLDKYTAAGMRTYRTDLVGTVVLQTNGTTLSVVGEAPTEPPVTTPSGSISTAPAPSTPAPSGKLEVHTIACDAGEATLVKSPDGKYMLIDTGANNNTSRALVQDYLRAQGVETLDYLVLSNNHENHIGGATLLMTTFPTAEVIFPNKAHTSKTYLTMVDTALDKAGSIAVVGENANAGLDALGVTPTVHAVNSSVKLGEDVTITFLAPLTYTGATSLGDASIVLRITYGTTSFLFTGNIDADIEADLVTAYPEGLAATVLKVANHGATTATSAAFVAAVSPDIALISAASAADASVSERLAGVMVYQTATDGTIVLTSDGTTVTKQTPAA